MSSAESSGSEVDLTFYYEHVDPLAQRLGRALYESSIDPDKPLLLMPSPNPKNFWAALTVHLAVEEGVPFPNYEQTPEEVELYYEKMDALVHRKK